MNAVKEIITHLIESFGLTDVNWGLQSRLAKSLLAQYSKEEIKFAIDWYKKNGTNLYSLGFLKYGDNMKQAMSVYLVEKYAPKGEGSGERNRERIANHSKAKRRTDAPEYLFAESGETD